MPPFRGISGRHGGFGYNNSPNGPFRGQSGRGEALPIFQLDFTGGLSALDDSLTINGTTVAPSALFDGVNATTSSWADSSANGYSLTTGGGGADPEVGFGTPMPNTVDEAAYLTANQKPYIGSTSSPFDIGTGDFVIELVYWASSAAQNIVYKRDATSGTQLIGGTPRILGYNATVKVFDVSGTANALTAGWNHLLVFADRSGSVYFYVNGAAAGSGSIAGGDGLSLVNATEVVRLGSSLTTAVQGGDFQFARVALWEQSSWLNGTTDLATVAAERFAKLTGTWANRGSVAPSTATRSSSAYLSKYTGSATELYLVGDKWIRVSPYSDGSETRQAVLVEDSAQNLALYSDDLLKAGSGGAWSYINTGTSATSSSIVSPDPAKFALEAIRDSGTGSGYFTQSQTFAAATQYAFSAYVKSGNLDWVELKANDGGGPYRAWFNLSTGSVGTESGNDSAYIKEIGGGWFRCSLIFTSQATPTGEVIQVFPADSDNTDNSTGDGSTVNLYLFGAQLETGAYPTSYVPTTSAAVTRGGDDCEYTLPIEVDPPLSIYWSTAHPTADFDLRANTQFFTLSDGGGAADRLYPFAGGGVGDKIIIGQSSTESGGSNVTLTTTPALSANTWTDLALTRQVDELLAFVDGVNDLTNTASYTPPNDLDRLQIGARYDAAGTTIYQHPIGPIKIYNKKVTP